VLGQRRIETDEVGVAAAARDLARADAPAGVLGRRRAQVEHHAGVSGLRAAERVLEAVAPLDPVLPDRRVTAGALLEVAQVAAAGNPPRRS